MDSRKVSNHEEPLSRRLSIAKNLHRGRIPIAKALHRGILLTTKIINNEDYSQRKELEL